MSEQSLTDPEQITLVSFGGIGVCRASQLAPFTFLAFCTHQPNSVSSALWCPVQWRMGHKHTPPDSFIFQAKGMEPITHVQETYDQFLQGAPDSKSRTGSNH